MDRSLPLVRRARKEVSEPMVKVCHLTQGVFEMPFSPDQTVGDYLAHFGGVGGGNTVSFNGRPVNDTTSLPEPGTLIVAPKIRNG